MQTTERELALLLIEQYIAYINGELDDIQQKMLNELPINWKELCEVELIQMGIEHYYSLTKV